MHLCKGRLELKYNTMSVSAKILQFDRHGSEWPETNHILTNHQNGTRLRQMFDIVKQ